MAAAREVLESPPPLTPARLRDFPYAARAFPTRYLLDAAGLDRQAPNEPGFIAPESAADARVE